jgi:hypothetical protein
MLIWQQSPGPLGFTSIARTPFAQRVFRVRAGKLVDVTPEFCQRIFSDENDDDRRWKSELTPDNVTKLGRSEKVADDNEEVVSGLLSPALQYVYCR